MMVRIFFSFVFCLIGFSLSGQIKINAQLLKLVKESAEITLDNEKLTFFVHPVALSEKDSSAYDVIEIRSGNETFTAFVDEVIGKTHLITYMVMFSSAGKIADMDVLIYRESYGGEIDYKVFKDQFRGKSSTDHLKAGKNIRNISGATISVNSVTRGVQKICSLYSKLKSELLL